MIWPRVPTSLSHSPSIAIPSINFCILPVVCILDSMRWHSPTTTVDTKVRGGPPPTACRCVWPPTPVDIFVGSERAKLRMPPVPEKVTASKNSLDATVNSYKPNITKHGLTFCWYEEDPIEYQNSKADELAYSTKTTWMLSYGQNETEWTNDKKLAHTWVWEGPCKCVPVQDPYCLCWSHLLLEGNWPKNILAQCNHTHQINDTCLVLKSSK